MSSSGLTLLFYGLAAVSVLAALGAVLSRHILRAALALMVVLLMSAGLYLLLDAEFLAGVQVLVYVGGIVVLLAFAIMLTSSMELLEDHPSLLRRLVGAVAAAAFFGVTTRILTAQAFQPATALTRTTEDAVVVGRMLLDRGATGYVLPFEIISLLLLAVVIGGVVVARKKAVANPAETKGEPTDARLP